MVIRGFSTEFHFSTKSEPYSSTGLAKNRKLAKHLYGYGGEDKNTWNASITKNESKKDD